MTNVSVNVSDTARLRHRPRIVVRPVVMTMTTTVSLIRVVLVVVVMVRTLMMTMM